MKHVCQLVLSAGLLLPAMQTKAEATVPSLHSIAVQQNSIVFELTGHGCSKDADFELRVEGGGTAITLMRNRADLCKRAPMVFRIKRSLSESGLSLQTPFAVRNPFAPPPLKRKIKANYK